MSHRFFLDSEIVENRTSLIGDQAHHAIQVMRFKVGDELTLFDGLGSEHVAVIVGSAKKKLDLEIRSTTHQDPPAANLTIACAMPKGDRQKFLVEKLVELGTRRLIPLQTKRSVAVSNEKVIERLKKQVIEASKQSGRNYLMQIESQQTIDQLIQSTAEPCVRLVADPYSQTDLRSFRSQQLVVIAIGPEGGFDDEEARQFDAAKWQAVRMGDNILRVETAAMTAAVLLGLGGG